MSAVGLWWASHWRARIILAVILTLTLIGDRALALVVQSRVQAAVTRAMPGADVSTTVGGYPVGLHLAADQLGRVQIKASGVQLPTEGHELKVQQITTTATGVHGIRSGREFRLDKVSGTVQLDWQELATLTSTRIRFVGDQVRIAGQVPVLGERLPGEVTGTLELDRARQQVVLLQPAGTLGEVPIPDDVLGGLLARLSSQLELPRVPGLEWTSLTPTQEGARLDFTGRDLVFRV